MVLKTNIIVKKKPRALQRGVVQQENNLETKRHSPTLVKVRREKTSLLLFRLLRQGRNPF